MCTYHDSTRHFPHCHTRASTLFLFREELYGTLTHKNSGMEHSSFTIHLHFYGSHLQTISVLARIFAPFPFPFQRFLLSSTLPSSFPFRHCSLIPVLTLSLYEYILSSSTFATTLFYQLLLSFSSSLSAHFYAPLYPRLPLRYLILLSPLFFIFLSLFYLSSIVISLFCYTDTHQSSRGYPAAEQ